MFLIHWFVSLGKKAGVAGQRGRGKRKGNKDDGSSWESEVQKENLLSVLINALELDLTRIWLADAPEEDFLNLFSKIF